MSDLIYSSATGKENLEGRGTEEGDQRGIFRTDVYRKPDRLVWWLLGLMHHIGSTSIHPSWRLDSTEVYGVGLEMVALGLKGDSN